MNLIPGKIYRCLPKDTDHGSIFCHAYVTITEDDHRTVFADGKTLFVFISKIYTRSSYSYFQFFHVQMCQIVYIGQGWVDQYFQEIKTT